MLVSTTRLRTIFSIFWDAFRRATQGALFAIWVPPAVTFTITPWSYLYVKFADVILPPSETLLTIVGAGLVLAGIAFIGGAMLLLIYGVPVLFCLRILRIHNPLVAAVAAACLMVWRFYVSPTNGYPFSGNPTELMIVAAITGYVSGGYANINPRLRDDVP
jgi:hypothetical protein